MQLHDAAILGILQGITEFLPISSSGHLVLAEHFLGLKDATIAFDVMLHMGTLLAVFAYFFRDWLSMLLSLFPGSNDKYNRRLLFYLIIGTIPGAVLGALLEQLAETIFRSPWVVVTTLSSVAIVLFLAERFANHVKRLDQLNGKDALVIGAAQALALIPGVSRSGITMTSALFLGFNRQAAAKFSFLLSAPIIAGAGLYESLKLIKYGGAGFSSDYLVGFLTSAISGYLVIAFLMNYLKRHSFYPFVIYRLALSVIVAAVLILNG